MKERSKWMYDGEADEADDRIRELEARLAEARELIDQEIESTRAKGQRKDWRRRAVAFLDADPQEAADEDTPEPDWERLKLGPPNSCEVAGTCIEALRDEWASQEHEQVAQRLHLGKLIRRVHSLEHRIKALEERDD